MSRIKLKIAIVLGPFLSLPPNPSGAVERIWEDLAFCFAKRGHYTKLVGKDLQKFAKERLKYISDIGENRCGNLLIEIFRDILYANRIANKVDGADIVISNSFSLPVILNERRKYGQKYKIVVSLARMPKGQLFLYRNAECIAAVSQAVLENIEKQNQSIYHKSIVIENPIDCSIFNAYGRKNQRNEKRKILYTGRICKEKGLEILLNATSILNKVSQNRYQLKIVGPYKIEDGGAGKKYLEKLKKLGGNIDVEFAEPIWDRLKLANEYRNADIFVYPSLAESGETFGVAPLEAMACGAVPIVSNLKCFNQYLKSGENGLVAKVIDAEDSEKALSESIMLLEDMETYQKIQGKGIKTAVSFDNEVIADKYISEFDRIMRRAR